MGKRTNAQAANKSGKKVKVDPALTCVADVIKQAEHLPEACRAMLVDMLPFSLSVPSDERHETQTWAVNAVEQTLDSRKAALEAASAAEDVKLATLKASEGDLQTVVTGAEAALDAQKAVVISARTSMQEKTAEAGAAGAALAALQEEQKAGEAKLSSTQEEKSALEPAFEAHFKLPMQEGAGPHFKDLQPFLKHIEMEASLLKAIPSSCSKSKEDRGSFDEVVLQELEKALSSKVKALGDSIDAETASLSTRSAAIQAAEIDLTAKKEAETQSTDVFEAAMKEQEEREIALTQAREAVENFQPEVEAMTALVEKAKLACTKFESGPLANFVTYKTRVAVQPSAEAAPAGA